MEKRLTNEVNPLFEELAILGVLKVEGCARQARVIAARLGPRFSYLDILQPGRRLYRKGLVRTWFSNRYGRREGEALGGASQRMYEVMSE